MSITSAVEGLESIPFVRNSGWTQELAVMVSIVIILLLFAVQSGGTGELGRLFGPVMTVWFLFMGIIGVLNLSGDWSALAALNPFAGISFLFSDANKAGVAIMGSVFPSITGAEALCSDMRHVGRRSIYVTWPSVCVCLMLGYFGQGAWMLGGRSQTLEGAAPFFQIIPESSRPVGATPALLAGVTASQALISGAFKNPARQGKHKQLERELEQALNDRGSFGLSAREYSDEDWRVFSHVRDIIRSHDVDETREIAKRVSDPDRLTDASFIAIAQLHEGRLALASRRDLDDCRAETLEAYGGEDVKKALE